jgi:hypothetical protein
MRVMVIVKASKESESGAMPDAELLAEMGTFNEQLIKAGVMVSGDGLKASSLGKRVHFSGTKRTVTDGPFAETKEWICGFDILDVDSMEEAIEIASRHPMARNGQLELRPFMQWEETAGA